jgi:Site-specific recombinase XerD
LNTPRNWQKAINKFIDLDHTVTLHGFRHTHGTLLMDNNPNLSAKDLQKRLGHKDLQTTINTYLHSTNKSDKKMLNALNNLEKKSEKSSDSNA